MKGGDLVVQRGWEASGVGLATKVWGHQGGGEAAYAAVHWPDGVVNHRLSFNELEIISESR